MKGWTASSLAGTKVGAAQAKPLVIAPDGSLSFTIYMRPFQAVRMNRADRWKKRPCVLEYMAARNAFRILVSQSVGPAIFHTSPFAMDAVFYMPLDATSWSEKKKAALDGKIHRQKPDGDNLWKATADTLFEEDKGIGFGSFKKYWCRPGKERIEVTLYFAPT